MDWIEGLFGISPDGGNGMTELAFLVACLGAVLLVVWRSKRRRRN